MRNKHGSRANKSGAGLRGAGGGDAWLGKECNGFHRFEDEAVARLRAVIPAACGDKVRQAIVPPFLAWHGFCETRFPDRQLRDDRHVLFSEGAVGPFSQSVLLGSAASRDARDQRHFEFRPNRRQRRERVKFSESKRPSHRVTCNKYVE